MAAQDAALLPRLSLGFRLVPDLGSERCDGRFREVSRPGSFKLSRAAFDPTAISVRTTTVMEAGLDKKMHFIGIVS